MTRPMPGDRFWVEGSEWIVDMVEPGGDDPMFYARLNEPGGVCTARWPVDLWDAISGGQGDE